MNKFNKFICWLLKMILFYNNMYPIKVIQLPGQRLFFKLRHLIKAFGISKTLIVKRVPPHCLVKFNLLKPFCTNETLYPSTLFISLRGLQYINNDILLKYLQKSYQTRGLYINKSYQVVEFDSDIEESDECEREYDLEKCTVGVVEPNIEFIKMGKRCYLKACDVARAINCASTYNIDKFVSDENMVLWADLREFLTKKCEGFAPAYSRWKQQTVFLKITGLKQLLLAKNQKTLFAQINLALQNYSSDRAPIYIKPTSRYYKKNLIAEQCVVGKMYNYIDFIMLPDTSVWCKLRMVRKYFSIKTLQDMSMFQEYTTTWSEIDALLRSKRLSCNIKWKQNTCLINGEGLYKLLRNFELNSQAERFYFETLHELKTKLKINVKV
ncbi:ORF88 [Agrotis segetum granulovirus]|uniref:ORF88 n=1 Tax=Agrotis segetum granulosis virus TaxID=10464 RepID=Q6QXM8_GVAS|nr:hypothetical protein AsGV102 [Agrotis segetum granulovirus]AAS82650.1 ORF88 [Agrotis segetum granulovirus]AHN92139.1 hypothetical protein AsGV100 [Agrotis segetum granulovirus]AKN63376.1 hypothetical protein AsGV102 [Agrotis segetum granulovirus]